jgi:hypothetical protein
MTMMTNMEVVKLADLVNLGAEPEVENGIALDDLTVGAVVEVETGHHTYRIENCCNGKILISGHPTYCPKPVFVELHGSTGGNAVLKFHFIGRGMHLEFRHPELGVIRTSRIKDVRELTPGPDLKKAS